MDRGTGHFRVSGEPSWGIILLCWETPNLLGSVQQVLTEYLECAKVD